MSPVEWFETGSRGFEELPPPHPPPPPKIPRNTTLPLLRTKATIEITCDEAEF